MSSNRRSLSDIETELDRNRDRMGDTLDALQHKLSTQDLFERSLGYLRSSGGEESCTTSGSAFAATPCR